MTVEEYASLLVFSTALTRCAHSHNAAASTHCVLPDHAEECAHSAEQLRWLLGQVRGAFGVHTCVVPAAADVFAHL